MPAQTYSHKDMTGADAVHVVAYIQTADPGNVGAGKLWIDTNTTIPLVKKRNAGNTDWDLLAGGITRFVVAASTANVSTSSAPSTLDGVTLAAGDRILLKDQSTAGQNGIYVFAGAGSALTRDVGADAAADWPHGLLIQVRGGTTLANSRWLHTTTAAITLGTTALTFARVDAIAKADAASPTFTGVATAPIVSVSGNTGALAGMRLAGATASGAPASGTYAVGDLVLDKAGKFFWYCITAGTPGTWRPLSPVVPVRVASTASVTIASALENGDSLDGVTLVTGDRVLLKHQTTASENGVYVVVASGAAARASEFDESAEMRAGTIFYASEGTTNGGKFFALTTSGTITLGSTPLAFTRVGAGDELGVAEITADISTTSETFVDATGLSVAVVVGDRPVYIEFSCQGAYHSVEGSVVQFELRDATSDTQLFVTQERTWVAGFIDHSIFHRRRVVPPAPGPRTYKVRYCVSGPGTGTIIAQATSPAQLTVREA